MAMGFCTSGSAAKTVALKPGGSRIFAAASLAGIGLAFPGSELYGTGKLAAQRLSDMSGRSSGVFMAQTFDSRLRLSIDARRGEASESFFNNKSRPGKTRLSSCRFVKGVKQRSGAQGRNRPASTWNLAAF